MNTNFMKSMTAAALLTLAALGAQAQELKIGYVNADRVLKDAAPAKAAQARLEAEFRPRDVELQDMRTRLKAAGERLDKEAPTLSETERVRRQRELIDQDREFQRKSSELQEDVARRRSQELASVIERANKVMKQIFDAEKFDLIIQEAVFFSPRVDITDKVIKALNAQPAQAAK